jgi:hypothetical protein
MFDELERLQSVQELQILLAHYANLGSADRQIWQDRLLEMDGVDWRELVKLHGELLAHGWIEQNTGLTPVLKKGAAPACYRVTSQGVRALRQVQGEREQAA